MHVDLFRLGIVGLLLLGLLAATGSAQTTPADLDAPAPASQPSDYGGQTAPPTDESADTAAPSNQAMPGEGAANEPPQNPPWAAATRAAPQGAVVVLLGLLIVSAVIGWMLVGRSPKSVKPMDQQGLARTERLPAGLVIFAVLHFLFGGVTLLVAVAHVVELASGRGNLYAFASPLVTAALFLVSGVGFIQRHPRTGLLAGVVLSIFSFANVLYWIIALGGVNILGLVYPVILFPFLYFKYRPEFYRHRSSGGAPVPTAA